MTGAGGRPRGFDRDKALELALLEFWKHGYDGTSISALTTSLGINPPSLYAAFGDKRRLFEEALELYITTHGSYGTRALAEPTAQQAVQTLLKLAAAVYTEPGHPPGCLVISGAGSHGPASKDVAARLRAQRDATKHALAYKIKLDIKARRLPAGTDAEALAGFYAAVVQGMNTQACDGATHEQLQAIADLAISAWPIP
jgi:AcrR family transcriptional regulator